ncbi:MAG TPA: GNAT family N-acetyltransferase [Actinomycetota bacterium]|nr:GNAT family N-acetyltransferase [Actinomycetota bacterium]
MSEYPAHREADVVLRDGSTVRIRPVRPEDRGAILAFLRGLSDEARWLRFFSGFPDLERAADSAVEVDYHDRFGLLALAGDEVVGHATHLAEGDRAEVGFAVADAYQGRGLGTIMLGQLAQAAAENGIHVFEAEVMPENRRMLDVFRESGFPIATRTEPGLIRAEFPTSLTREALERFDRREQVAAVNAIRSFLSPSAVAVIGASRTRGSIGGEVFHNLLVTGFQGPVYPVNPKTPVVQSVAAYPSIRDVPETVDLGVIVVPASAVLEVAKECAEGGVRSLVVISSGFAEVGEEGAERQSELLAICRDAGMRLIGPNCMGIVNTDPEVRLNASFAPAFPPHGRVGFLSQSGALGLAVIDRAADLGLGLSSFVSVGNKADVSGNDLLNYWESDEGTDVILLYLESFGNPRRFSRVARRVGRSKPIVAVKSGRSAAGARATSSHTGALIAASDVTVDALFRQTGVVRTDTLEELFDVASLFVNQPLPSGKRVGIVTNAGGLGILCADACEAGGLEVPTLSEGAIAKLRRFLPDEASPQNPVDMIASASADDYRKTIEIVAGDGGVDAIVVIFIPPLVTRTEDVARAIREAAEAIGGRIPVLTVFMSARGVPAELHGEDVRIPSYSYPEDAARALAHAAQYAEWRERPEGAIPTIEARSDEAGAMLGEVVAAGPRWLEPHETFRLLDCYGIPVAPWRLVETPEEAGRAAEELGEEVALKAVAPTLIHKTEAGAVRLSLRGAEAARTAAEEMAAAVKQAEHEVEGFLVQTMVRGGIEMLVGVVHDALFGPVVACGAGGTTAELMKDVAVRITPLSDLDAAEMIRSLQTFPLLEGYRGAPGGDVAALEDLLLRVGAMVEENPAIAEMDLNPVIVLPEGLAVVDARVRAEVPAPRRPLSARRA